jgi:purine-binding chemotaxis protein CheW
LPEEQWISFQVESEIYVHPISQIKEIIPYIAPVPVPGSPVGTEGILNVRGDVVAILSGRVLLGQEVPIERHKWRVIILELETGKVGISIDSVGEIISFNASRAQWTSQSEQHQPIKGTILKCDQLYILTDFSECALAKTED